MLVLRCPSRAFCSARCWSRVGARGGNDLVLGTVLDGGPTI